MSNKLNRSKQGRAVTPAHVKKKQEESYELTELDRKLPYVQAAMIVIMVVLLVLYFTKTIGDLVAMWILAAAYFGIAAYRERRNDRKRTLNRIFMAIYVVISIINIIALM